MDQESGDFEANAGGKQLGAAPEKGSLRPLFLDFQLKMQLLEPGEWREGSSAVLNSLLEACERSCQWQLALELLQRLPRSAVSYSAAVMCCVQATQWPVALQLFKELSQVGDEGVEAYDYDER